MKKPKKNKIDMLWKLTITEFYLSIYALGGKSGLPPSTGGKAGKELAIMTLRGTADETVGTPPGLVFYIRFFPDGSDLAPPGVTTSGGKTWVEMQMNVSQLNGVISFLGCTPNSTAQYEVKGGKATATIIGDHRCLTFLPLN